MATAKGSLSRAIAIDALTHVLTRNIHADRALEKLFKTNTALSPLDRSFIFEMVYGSLRWLSKMDWIMGHMSQRAFNGLDIRVLNALRVGCYQIFYMDRVPDRAAVSETVEAIKLVGAGTASSFVNAILRRVAKRAEYFPKPDKDKETAEFLSMHHAYPRWLVDRWIKWIPLERLEFMLSKTNTPPSFSLHPVSQRPISTGEDLATYLLREHSISSEWRPLKTVLRVEKLPPFATCKAFAEGCYYVQEESAQVASQIVQPTASDTVLDACAAPGGKALYLWDAGADPKKMTLCDVSQKRIVTLEENLKRHQLKVKEILHGDVVEQTEGRKFSKVVLDAPCSALGVIRRHPEIKWLRHLGDLEASAKEQTRLLNGLAPRVAPGGELIYIVCSQEPEETTEQISVFLNEHKNFEIVSLNGRIHDYYRKYLVNDTQLLILPGNSDEMDGFFAAVLRKKKT